MILVAILDNLWPRLVASRSIANEFTHMWRLAGTFDALIVQNSGHLAVRSVVRFLRATADSVPFNETQGRISVDIYPEENIPSEMAV